MVLEIADRIEKVQRISVKPDEDVLKKNLQRYVELAKQMGATDAKYIPASEVVIDPRTPLKCMYPKCHQSGISAFCPPSPFVMDPEQTKKIRDLYRWAVVAMIQTPSKDFVCSLPVGQRKGRPPDYTPAGSRDSATQIYKILCEVEAMAFYDGYYYSMGFGSGPCKSALCQGQPCTLQEGQQCRFPLRARPAAEAVGIDSYATARKLGWDIYPIGQRSLDVAQPHALRVVTVFID